MSALPIYLRAHCRTPIAATTDTPWGLARLQNTRILVLGEWRHPNGWGTWCPDCHLFGSVLRARVIKVLP